GTKVLCPMPGTIVAVNVKEGDAVKAGQAIFSLEAMKMESDITAPVDGVVANLAVRKGDTTEAGSLLCSIE
ncbi:MAG TPA: biotin/lipoyl-containing protein, partial [Feifaniaceae bacterium]|nr:biotin/lipoyl-containing protein [Feifaniaceae bacterium]